MEKERVAILLMANWTISCGVGDILVINKENIRPKNIATQIVSRSHYSFYGTVDVDFKVLDFISDPDNISDQEIEFVKMLYPNLEIRYEKRY